MKMHFTTPSIDSQINLGTNKVANIKIESGSFELEYTVEEFLEIMKSRKEGLPLFISFIKDDLKNVIRGIMDLAHEERDYSFKDDQRWYEECQRRNLDNK